MNQAQIQRDLAIDRVEAGAPNDWIERAVYVIRQLTRERVFITTDEVWERMDAPPEPRAMGAAMRRAQREGIIRPSDQVRNSNRPACHARPIRIWIAT